MYTVLIVHTPAPGKGPELRAALEEHSKVSNAAGGKYALFQSMYTREPAFVNAKRYDSLAALEAYQASMANDAARMARLTKVSACLARPQTSTLWENLTAAQVSAPPNYRLIVTFYPAVGKGGELRKVLEERARAGGKGLVGAALSTQVAPPDGANYRATLLFANLAGLEEWRHANQADPAFAAFQSRLVGLLDRPNRQILTRILLPFPTA